ncbi:MAG TPA: multicopper oxidase domain-containing protein [Blastocatellia bacterium]|nr:multicopper oxidase domain-containing protein [Blastocatellia bacterium]
MAYISKIDRRRERERKIAAKNRRELIAAQLTRRDLMKMGLLTSAGYLIPKKGLSARAESGGRYVVDDPQSPPVTPFVDDLPIPAIARPVDAPLNPAPTIPPNTAAGEARTRDHQRFNEFFPNDRVYYEFRVREAAHRFHQEYDPDTIYGFTDRPDTPATFPGPTYHAFYNRPILVRMRNELRPVNEPQPGGFGRPEITIHLHNGHTPSESDGFPGDFFGRLTANDPFKFYDQHYPNILAGWDTFPPTGDERETMNTLWYHDHRFDFTAQNVYKGLAGFYLLFDSKDSNNEQDLTPGAFRLPSGAFDIPLIFADKVFDEDTAKLVFDQFELDGILGDRFTVNGKIQPRLRVHPRKYRFRLLDGGPSRFYEFFLSNNQPFTLISNDGNLLPAPLQVSSVRLGVAERVDVIIDFTGKQGQTIYLENRLEQTDGRGPTGNILPQSQATRLLKFEVTLPQVEDPSQVPASFRALPPTGGEVATRIWRFDRTNGQWAINNELFNVNVVRATPRRGTAEKWVLQNNSGGWEHPIHIHFEEFQILTRNGVPIPDGNREKARKDVVRLGRNETVELFMRFREFEGRYPMHCHNTIHEDHAMMLRWDIIPPA